MQELARVENELRIYRNRAQHVNQPLVTAFQDVNQADSRRVRAETAAETARRELIRARAERDAAAARRDALEEVVARLTRERDSAVAASEEVRDICARLEEANLDVNRLTTNVNELYQANAATVESLYEQRYGGESQVRVLRGLEDARLYHQAGDSYVQHALYALNLLINSRRLGESATILAHMAVTGTGHESDAVRRVQFHLRMARERWLRLIQEQRKVGRRQAQPPSIVSPVAKGSQAERDDRAALSALVLVDDLSDVDQEDSEDDLPLTQMCGRGFHGPPGGDGGDGGGEGGTAAVCGDVLVVSVCSKGALGFRGG